MYKLKNKKGFTLIEVLCSITLFSIVFLTVVRIQMNSLSVKRYSQQLYDYSAFIESLKNNIIYNCDYDDICSLKSKASYYIAKDNMTVDKVQQNGIEALFQKEIPNSSDYLQITIEGTEVLRINLKLYSKFRDKNKIMEGEFYKGKYKVAYKK